MASLHTSARLSTFNGNFTISKVSLLFASATSWTLKPTAKTLLYTQNIQSIKLRYDISHVWYELIWLHIWGVKMAFWERVLKFTMSLKPVTSIPSRWEIPTESAWPSTCVQASLCNLWPMLLEKSCVKGAKFEPTRQTNNRLEQKTNTPA